MKRILKGLVIGNLLLIHTIAFGQVPYAEIPPYPENYTAGTVAARMIDGLGFRFYWATEGLRTSDLDFRPGQDTRSVMETIDHVYEMTFLITNSVLSEKRQASENATFEEKRTIILQNLFDVREILLKSENDDFENYQASFSNGASFPFWNLINGPIEDCVWHCGQIVMMRRMAGNPFNSNVSLFRGKVSK